jgi:hypothetical protein
VTWPDRAIRRGGMKLALTGDATAVLRHISLVRSGHAQLSRADYYRQAKARKATPREATAINPARAPALAGQLSLKGQFLHR